MTVKTPNEIFRDYVTDGVPSSGAQKPVKSDIRELLNALVSAIGGVAAPRQVTAAGVITVAADDRYISVNKTVGAATTVVFGLSANKSGDCVIKDGKGDAATNNISVTFTAGELCDGLATVVINTAYDEYRFRPNPAGGGYQLGK